MTEKVDLNSRVDDIKEAAEKYASANTVISIGGYEFTPAKLMVLGTVVSTLLGGLYGAFEVYKDYMSMKEAIKNYVSPDLSEINKKLEVLEANTNKTVEYSRDIKNDLKSDIRRLETVVENIERDSKIAQRETDKSVQDARKDVRVTRQEVDQLTRNLERDNAQQNRELQRYVDSSIKQVQRESQAEVRQLRRDLDEKIQRALDNPLAK
jgi:hypothetical protein